LKIAVCIVSANYANMNPSSIYLVILIITGVALMLNLLFVYNKQKRRLSRLAGVAFAFVIAGVFLGGQQWVGDSLLGVGVILAIIDIVQKNKIRISQ